MTELTMSLPIAPLLILYWGLVTIAFYFWTRRQRTVRAIRIVSRSGSGSSQLELSIPLGAFVLCLAPLIVGLALVAL